MWRGLIIFLLLTGCCTIGDQFGQNFIDYHYTWLELAEFDGEIDQLITVRVRIFGSEKAKQEAWIQEWRNKNPKWGPAGTGVHVSSQPPQVWLNMRKLSDGRWVLDPPTWGHELWHEIHNWVPSVIDPDKLIEIERR